MRWAEEVNVNALTLDKLKKKVPFTLAVLRVLTSCLKYRNSAQRRRCREEYVVQIDVWTVILKNEVSLINRGGRVEHERRTTVHWVITPFVREQEDSVTNPRK
jgi:hypothetical protein